MQHLRLKQQRTHPAQCTQYDEYVRCMVQDTQQQSARYPVHRRYKVAVVSCGGIVHYVHHDMRQQRRPQGQSQLRPRAQGSVAYVDTTGTNEDATAESMVPQPAKMNVSPRDQLWR
jgi:hypothetical protein